MQPGVQPLPKAAQRRTRDPARSRRKDSHQKQPAPTHTTRPAPSEHTHLSLRMQVAKLWAGVLGSTGHNEARMKTTVTNKNATAAVEQNTRTTAFDSVDAQRSVCVHVASQLQTVTT